VPARGQRALARLGPGHVVAAACVLAGTLLALVALAARAYRPVSGDEPDREPSAQFIDFFFTGAAILWTLGAVLLVFLWTGQARKDPQSLRIRIGLPGFLLLVGVVLVFAFGPELLDRFQAGDDEARARTGTIQTATAESDRPGRRRSPEFEWPLAVAVGIGLLIGAGILVSRRPRRQPDREELALALADELDETIDDLRLERDRRRAVIAAYARMERLLGAYGVPRLPSEAPLEYLERVLLELDAGERPVETLTGLFQEAKFSKHELELGDRDRAIDALVEIRDDLRAQL
jgi:hypothetical protein